MRRFRLLLGAAALVCLAACNSSKDSDSTAKDDNLPDWMQESDRTAKAEKKEKRPREEPRVSLELNLKVGERFGLRKGVDTTLQQSSPDGTAQVVVARIEMLLGLTVEDVSDKGTRLAVRYERVKFSQGSEGQRVEYDSATDQSRGGGLPSVANVPPLARPYHNMVRDGFSFWIGKENQITEVVGFKEFLERCMAGIPDQDRMQQMLNMEAASDENGISDFVDNTIGLLPYGRSITPGDTWDRTRHIGRPVPMKLLQQYTLKDLSSEMAMVDIRGSITPSTTVNDVKQDRSGVRVTVTGGALQGDCAIYRDSGLPQRSYVERVVDMVVMTAGKHEFKQKKIVRTTVEAFPMQGAGNPTVLSRAGEASNGGPIILPSR